MDSFSNSMSNYLVFNKDQNYCTLGINLEITSFLTSWQSKWRCDDSFSNELASRIWVMYWSLEFSSQKLIAFWVLLQLSVDSVTVNQSLLWKFISKVCVNFFIAYTCTHKKEKLTTLLTMQHIFCVCQVLSSKKINLKHFLSRILPSMSGNLLLFV